MKPSYKRRIPFLVKIGIFILIFGSVSILFAGQNLTSNYFIESTTTTSEITTLSKTTSPRASVTHDPIFIDGDDGGNDWDTFPNETGSGTFADPYIIQNFEINASGSGSGIYIRDSSVYAKIINCTVSNSEISYLDAGIRLSNCTNIQIITCTSAYNGGNGIRIDDNSYNNTLSGNNASYNSDYGINILSSYNNTLYGNNASYNSYYGIYLGALSNNNTLSGNSANHNNANGIYLSSSSNNTLSGNSANHNNASGIVLWSSSNNNTLSENIANHNNDNGINLGALSNNNTLSGNDASYNSIFGIYLLSSYSNTISGNDASYNSYYGIYLFSSNDTTLFDNSANNNMNGIYLGSSNNNTFLRNDAKYNDENGIYLGSSDNNTFLRNDASFNNIGIYLPNSCNNAFFLNIFLENTFDAADGSTSFDNLWDDGTHGNYWGDVKEKYPAATNNLMIWNTPYVIDEYNTDYFPLATMDGSVGINSNPTISKPIDMTFTSGYVEDYLEWIIWDSDALNPNYFITQNGTQVQSGSWVPGTPIRFNMSTLDSLSEGNYAFIIHVYDGLGGFVTDTVYVSVTALEIGIGVDWRFILLGFFVLVGGGAILIRKYGKRKLISEDKDDETGDGGNGGEGNVSADKDGIVGKRAYLSTGEQKEPDTQQKKPPSEMKLPATIKEDMESEFLMVNRLIDEGLFTQAILSLKSMKTKTKDNKKLRSLNKKIVRRLEFAETTAYFQNKKDILWREYKSNSNLQETYLKFRDIVGELNQIPHEAKIIQLSVVKDVFDTFEIIEKEFQEKKTKEILEEIETVEKLLIPQGISEANKRFLQMKADYSHFELSEINAKIETMIKICAVSIPINEEISTIWTQYQDQNLLIKSIKDFEDLEKKIELSPEKYLINPSIVENLKNKEDILKKELSENRASLESQVGAVEKLLNPESISKAVNIIRTQQKNAELFQFTDVIPRLSEMMGELENIQKIFDVFKRTKRMSIADISKRVAMPRDELIDFVFDPSKGLQMLEIDGDYLILKKGKDQMNSQILKRPTSTSSPQAFSDQDVKITRGGDWKIEGNLSVFHYKVKVLNKSKFVITQIQILLTSLPKGLEVEKDRYIINSLKPKAYESPTFKFKANESCVGDFIEGIVVYTSHTGQQITSKIEPFEICYVCNLLVPKRVSQQEFDQKTEFMKESRLTIESDLEFSDLERKIEGIIHNCNFALLQKLNQNQSSEFKKFEAFAEGLYDKQDVGLSVAVKKMETGSQLIVKAMSDRTDKITDLLRDFNVKLDDIKSDTELIKEYTSQIEDLFDHVEDLEFYLRDKLQTDFEKIKDSWWAYKNGQINKKELIAEGIRLMGKKFVSILIDKSALLF